MKQTLFLMLGYPGAGKTTTAKIIAELTGASYLSSDDTRAELFPNSKFTPEEHKQLYEVIDEKTKHLLSEGKSVVFDANLNRFAHRQEKYDICETSHVQAILIWVQTDKTIAKDRATHASRQHLWPPNETAENMFDRIANILEPPKPDETHITIDGTKVTKEYVKSQLEDAGVL